MIQAKGSVVDAVTRKPIRSVSVVLLGWDPKAAARYEPGMLIGVDADALSDLPARRLATTTTDRAGQFSLDSAATDGALLTLVVLGQQTWPGAGGVVRGALGALRSEFGREERLVIPVASSARHSPTTHGPSPRPDGPDLANRYREDRDAALERESAAPPLRGFHGSLNLRKSGGQGGASALTFNRKTGGWTIRSQGKVVKLHFTRAAVEDQHLDASAGAPPERFHGIEVDPEVGSFRLVLPRFVPTLTAPAAPSELLRSIVVRRRTDASAAVNKVTNAPEPENSPAAQSSNRSRKRK